MKMIPKPYEVYKHFKGNLYQIITLAEDSETGEQQVVYQGLHSPYKMYVRSLKMFLSPVERDKYKEVKQEYRFEKVEETVPSQEVKAEAEPVSKAKLNKEMAKESDENAFYDAEEVLEPLLLDFLDSDTYEEKMNILVALRHRLTDDMINTMAMALDVEVNDGKLNERYEGLKNCLATLQRYECNRLR